jgi:streptomycin 6-kinase
LAPTITESGETTGCGRLTGVTITPLLARNVAGAWGDAGRTWLDTLPATLADVYERWQLTPGAPFAMTYHWVMAVTRADGEPAVLKLGVPSSEHLHVEAAALRAWNGSGAARLLEHDTDRGVLLLERAEPGTRVATLVPHDDATATSTLMAVMHNLHATPPPATGVPELRRLTKDFANYLRGFPSDGPLPTDWVPTAARLFEELCDSAPARVLLHGDLHHDNVLRATRQPWLAIDPHGYVGDPGYDLSSMLYNPDPADRGPELMALLPNRLDQLTDESGQPRERVVAWCFVMAVLSEVWACEGGGEPSGRPLDVAAALRPML